MKIRNYVAKNVQTCGQGLHESKSVKRAPRCVQKRRFLKEVRNYDVNHNF